MTRYCECSRRIVVFVNRKKRGRLTGPTQSRGHDLCGTCYRALLIRAKEADKFRCLVSASA